MPKISLNQWYSGEHWSKRKHIKDKYYWIIKSQFKAVFPPSNIYEVEYRFLFKTKPLDASNCIAMVKMIEDILFENDEYRIIKRITITSEKSAINSVFVNIKIL